MQPKSLSSSFSANELKNISSYRQQRMRSKPRINQSTDIIQPLAVSNTARKDLEQIQECLKNNLSRRRSSQGCLASVLGRGQPESTVSRLRRQTELDSPVVSDYLAADGELGRTRQFHHKYDSALNVIEEKPNNFTISKRQVTGGLKGRILLNSSKNLMPSTAINKPRTAESNMPDLTLKQASSVRAANAKRQLKGSQNLATSKFDKKQQSCQNNRGNRLQAMRLLKKLEALREQCERAPLRKHHEMNVYFDKLAECLRQE